MLFSPRGIITTGTEMYVPNADHPRSFRGAGEKEQPEEPLVELNARGRDPGAGNSRESGLLRVEVMRIVPIAFLVDFRRCFTEVFGHFGHCLSRTTAVT